MSSSKLTPFTLLLMAVGSGLVVANNYYNQPLLGLMSKEFKVTESEISAVSMLTQIGYACGLFFFIPLGDMFRRKRLILLDMLFVILALLVMGFSTSLQLLYPASFIVGFTSVVPQLFVPMTAVLAKPDQKAKAVGIVMSGLLVGVLGSRVLSGYIGDIYGWREMYYIAVVLMIVLLVLLWIKLPEVYPTFKGSYKDLMLSLFLLFKKDASLRIAATRGALAFGSLSVFWTPLVFHLEKNFNLSSGDASNIAGKFGIIGMGGALAAAMTGRFINKYDKKHFIYIFILLIISSWILFYFGGYTYLGLIFGVILIDVGAQAAHITNQTIIFSNNPEATNRVNTIYMTSFFIGGSLATYISAYAFEYFDWSGVAITGGVFALILLLCHMLTKKI